MTVIAALVALFKMIAGPVIDLTKTMTKLIYSVDSLSVDLADSTTKNHVSHGKLWEHNAEQDIKLCNHDMRINDLEKNEKNEQDK